MEVATEAADSGAVEEGEAADQDEGEAAKEDKEDKEEKDEGEEDDDDDDDSDDDVQVTIGDIKTSTTYASSMNMKRGPSDKTKVLKFSIY